MMDVVCCSARSKKKELFWSRDPVTGAKFITSEGEPFKPTPGAVLVLTLRMGFGHLRIAHAMASWLEDREYYVYDLLAVSTPETKQLTRIEWFYSTMSRMAAASGGPVEWAWDRLLMGGNTSAQSKLRDIALALKPLTDGLPLDLTVIATHAVAGHIGVEAGFHKVINLVVDNHAQHFNAVPGAINAVQAGALGVAYAKLGYQTVLAGHWVGKRLGDGIKTDAARRMQRIRDKAPFRLLISIGGAGAQQEFIIQVLGALQPGMARNRWHVVLNCGDIASTQAPLKEAASKLGVAVETVDTWDRVLQLWETNTVELSSPLTLVCCLDKTEAVAATDLLSSRADMAAWKPGELAFYPVPKLLIRRVGAHEAASAVRAAELGDATSELRTADEFEKTLTLIETTDLLLQMNRAILANEDQYQGCKRISQTLVAGTKQN